MQKHDYKELGSFQLTGEFIRVSDPCYDRNVWCCGTISNCVPGQWNAAVVYYDDDVFGRRVALLCAKAGEVKSFNIFSGINIGGDYYKAAKPWEMCDNVIGVDSGQCGIFDETHYLDNDDFADMPKASCNFGDAFYDHCCDATLNEDQAGVLPHGVVSCSGIGDGSYRAFVRKNADGKVCAVAVSYL